METDANKNEKRRKEDRSVVISAMTSGGEEVPILNLEDERPMASPKKEKEGRSVMMAPTNGQRSVMMAPNPNAQRSMMLAPGGGTGRSVMMAPSNGQRSVMMAPTGQQSVMMAPNVPPPVRDIAKTDGAQRSVMAPVTAVASVRQKASTSLRQKAKAVASAYQKLKDSSSRQRKPKDPKPKQLQSTQTPSQRTITQSQKQKRKKKKKTDDPTVTAAEPSIRKESPAEQLRKELNEGPPYRKLTLEFDYEGQQLGIRLHKTKKDLMVVVVDQRADASPLWNKIRPGDCVLTVNGRSVATSDGFYEAVRRANNNAPGRISLGINRQIRMKPVSENRQKRLNIPANSKGDYYYTAYLFNILNAKLGIAVKAQNERVVMLKVDESGLGAGALEIGDFVLDVDGIPVKGTEETKKLIINRMHTRGYVSVVVQHPMTEESLNLSREILGNAVASPHVDPDMKIGEYSVGGGDSAASDAVLIGRAEIARRRRGELPRATKILVRDAAKQSRQQRSVTVADRSSYVEHDIASDVDRENWNELESVPGRVDADWKPKKSFKDRLKCLFTRFAGGSKPKSQRSRRFRSSG